MPPQWIDSWQPRSSGAYTEYNPVGGDLIDDYYVDIVYRNDQQFLFLVTAAGSRVERIELVPVLISQAQANTAQGAAVDPILARMQRLSGAMGTELRREGDRLVIDIVEQDSN